MADSTIVVLTDSVRRMSHSLDSLNEVVRTLAVRQDCWLQTLQGQTALYVLVTAALVALVATFNWVAGRREIRRSTTEEFAKQSKRLDDKATAIESELLRTYCELKGDMDATMAKLCENGQEWTSAVVYWVHSAILAASSENWSESIARITSAEYALEMHTAEIKLTAGDVGGFRREFGEVKDTEASAPARRRLETLLARFDNAVVKLSGTGSQPVQDSGDSADKS